MAESKKARLKKQVRPELTCMFRDMQFNTCSIYDARPEICKMFGFYDNLVCPSNPSHAVIDRVEGAKRLAKGGKHKGVLTLQITWDNIMDKK